MSSVNEAIVREYFEALGFLVIEPCKYIVPGRHKRAEEEIDLIVVNPTVTEQKIPDEMIWTASSLKGIARAVVGIYGGHTERFSTSRIEKTPEVLHLAAERTVEIAAKRVGSRDMACILCVPELSVSSELRSRTLKLLREKGVHGLLSFRTMLLELVARVSTTKNYEKSDLLQILRVMKNYDLIKESQMELFVKSRRKRKTAEKKPPEPAPEPKAQ
jgi:hypothetical protein